MNNYVINLPLVTFYNSIVINLHQVVYVSPSYRVSREGIEDYETFISEKRTFYIENYEVFLSNGKSFTIENKSDYDEARRCMPYDDFVDAWHRAMQPQRSVISRFIAKHFL